MFNIRIPDRVKKDLETVANMRANGASDADIRAFLKSRGWKDADSDSWLESAVKTAGRAVGTVVTAPINVAETVIDTVGKGISAIPIVGDPLYTVYDAGNLPFQVASAAVKGERIDKALVKGLENQVKAIKAVAPYAQTVASMVPGIGTGVAAAIAAGSALAQGRPIDEAIVAGVRGAIPGGPIATAAFDVGYAAMRGRPIDEVALNALPVGPAEKTAIIQGFAAAKDIADGRRVDQAIVDRGIKALPPTARAAVQTGLALAEGENLQDIMRQQAGLIIPQLVNAGASAIDNNEVLRAGLDTVDDEPLVEEGYQLGVGIMSHNAGQVAITEARKQLNAEQQRGYDLAVAAWIGLTTQPITGNNPHEQFGYAVTHGMDGQDPTPRMSRPIMKTPPPRKVKTSAAVKAGVSKAIGRITTKTPPKIQIASISMRPPLTLWQKVKGVVLQFFYV